MKNMLKHPVTTLLAIVAVAIGAWWVKSDQAPVNSEAIAALTTEFNNAYAAESVPNGTVKEFSLLAQESEVELIDGTKTTVWSYNGQVPGPEIRVTKGDTVRVSFTNQLPQATTIHWHGIRVPNAMDGVPGVTQELIQPGQDFTYEFTPKDAGTFWYHPHHRSNEQVERGLYGTLIVEDPADPAYSADRVMVLDDWRLLEDGQVDPRFNNMHDFMHDGRWGSTITTNGQIGYELSARPGERLRLRFVNTANGRLYRLSFNNLPAQVIAVDGMAVGKTFSAESYELAPGNRFDVDLSVPLSTPSSPLTITDTFTRNPITLATLAINGDPVEPPSFTPPVAHYFPTWANAAQAPLTHEYTLSTSHGGHHGVGWTINGQAHPNTDVITLKANEFQKIRFSNNSPHIHPMHLHGQFFKVVARDGRAVDEPYWRDTVIINPNEAVDIALVPQDKGEWANHCHVLEHAEAGMMSMIRVE